MVRAVITAMATPPAVAEHVGDRQLAGAGEHQHRQPDGLADVEAGGDGGGAGDEPERDDAEQHRGSRDHTGADRRTSVRRVGARALVHRRSLANETLDPSSTSMAQSRGRLDLALLVSASGSRPPDLAAVQRIGLDARGLGEHVVERGDRGPDATDDVVRSARPRPPPHGWKSARATNTQKAADGRRRAGGRGPRDPNAESKTAARKGRRQRRARCSVMIRDPAAIIVIGIDVVGEVGERQAIERERPCADEERGQRARRRSWSSTVALMPDDRLRRRSDPTPRP